MNTPHANISAVTTGIKATCPRCGKGPLFVSLVNIDLRDKCDSCGMSYKFIDTGDGPAWFTMLILCVGVLGAALWIEFRFEPPLWVHLIMWGVLTPMLALFMLRFLKALLVALQFKHKAEEGRLSKD